MAMFNIIITLDYELFTGGRGDVRQHMIKPTSALIDICKTYGAKLTVMVEMGELWAFEKRENAAFSKNLGYEPAIEIRRQLVDVVEQGHDVQLHLHPQWLNALWGGTAWKLDYAHYKLTDFNNDEMIRILRWAKEDLETWLRPHCPDYECIGFRAGNWNTQPSSKYLRALSESGLKSDTSVFKWAYTNTPSVFIDYRHASSNVLPWIACWEDINRSSSGGRILEVPIYTEAVSLFGLLSARRLRSAIQYFREDRQIAQEVKASTQREGYARSGLSYDLSRIFRVYPKKLDFCKLSWKEMVGMIENVHYRFAEDPMIDHVPIVMIGHSKESMSSADIRRFLEVVSTRYKDSISFSTYREFIKQYRLAAG